MTRIQDKTGSQTRWYSLLTILETSVFHNKQQIEKTLSWKRSENTAQLSYKPVIVINKWQCKLSWLKSTSLPSNSSGRAVISTIQLHPLHPKYVNIHYTKPDHNHFSPILAQEAPCCSSCLIGVYLHSLFICCQSDNLRNVVQIYHFFMMKFMVALAAHSRRQGPWPTSPDNLCLTSFRTSFSLFPESLGCNSTSSLLHLKDILSLVPSKDTCIFVFCVAIVSHIATQVFPLTTWVPCIEMSFPVLPPNYSFFTHLLRFRATLA